MENVTICNSEIKRIVYIHLIMIIKIMQYSYSAVTNENSMQEGGGFIKGRK